jgi:hypothetical protein
MVIFKKFSSYDKQVINTVKTLPFHKNHYRKICLIFSTQCEGQSIANFLPQIGIYFFPSRSFLYFYSHVIPSWLKMKTEYLSAAKVLAGTGGQGDRTGGKVMVKVEKQVGSGRGSKCWSFRKEQKM